MHDGHRRSHEMTNAEGCWEPFSQYQVPRLVHPLAESLRGFGRNCRIIVIPASTQTRYDFFDDERAVHTF
jgi:hypothetical protein